MQRARAARQGKNLRNEKRLLWEGIRVDFFDKISFAQVPQLPRRTQLSPAPVPAPGPAPIAGAMASADCSAGAPCWQHLGRSTPAGRALYNLFCTDQGGRRMGNSFSERNRALDQLQAARRAADASASAALPASPQCAQPAAKLRPRVRAPRFQRQARRAPSAASPRGRRPAHSILAEARAAEAQALAAGPPAPRPGLGDAEKERLALLMQFGGNLPASAGTQGVGVACARAPRRGLWSELLLLLEQVPQPSRKASLVSALAKLHVRACLEGLNVSAQTLLLLMHFCRCESHSQQSEHHAVLVPGARGGAGAARAPG